MTNSDAPIEGRLFVISAPSGTGKSTVARRVLELEPEMEWSVSYTTRPAREGEVDGRDYHFIGGDTFDQMVEQGAFLEWARVFDRRYGTGVARTREALAAGRDLLLEIDVQGAEQVRGSQIETVSIMILPPDFPTLEARLRGRGSETDDQLRERLTTARREAARYEYFDYTVINDDLDRAIEDVRAIVYAERLRSRRRTSTITELLKTFPA
ncbi:MAG: guanylate kinase [Acidobacteriota bacterium]|nr:guanylate kinase [Acidobacteriota bacterium]MDH3785029.1 guanylate kinase [Acidobacteriota bacterium]